MRFLQDWFSKAINFGPDTSEFRTEWARIVSSYSEPQRYYHDLTHLENLLLAQIKAMVPMTQELLLTTFYHDLIYVVGIPIQSSNEELSAKAFESIGKSLGLAEELIQRVSSQIRLTQYSGGSQTLFGDFDFAGFSNRAQMARNSWLIRCEHASISNTDYAKGCVSFYSKLRAIRIYSQLTYLEADAQENIQLELDVLNTGYSAWEDYVKSIIAKSMDLNTVEENQMLRRSFNQLELELSRMRQLT